MNASDVQREFEELARNFYTLFETKLAVFDRDKRIICSYPPHMGPFCALVRTDEELARRCLHHDSLAFEECDRTLKPYIYHCHMGLVEVAAPIVGDGIILGYLLFGQITDDQHQQLILDRLQSLDTGPSRAELARLLQYVPFRTPEYIRAMSSVLAASAAYIQVSDIFARQKDSLSYLISEYIRQNLSNGVSLTAICTHFGISRSALYALSRRAYGMGISDYINHIRINVAKRLLRTTTRSISDIALSVGIPDASYFTRLFKRQVSQSPSSYRQGLSPTPPDCTP